MLKSSQGLKGRARRSIRLEQKVDAHGAGEVLSRPCREACEPLRVILIICESWADQFFVRQRPVNLGGVEEGDALLDGCPDQRNCLLLVCGRAVAEISDLNPGPTSSSFVSGP